MAFLRNHFHVCLSLSALLQKTQSVLDLKEEDYSQVVKSRDDAIRENQKMKEQISATEEREKRKVTRFVAFSGLYWVADLPQEMLHVCCALLAVPARM